MDRSLSVLAGCWYRSARIDAAMEVEDVFNQQRQLSAREKGGRSHAIRARQSQSGCSRFGHYQTACWQLSRSAGSTSRQAPYLTESRTCCLFSPAPVVAGPSRLWKKPETNEIYVISKP
jgi:hypothetical protein